MKRSTLLTALMTAAIWAPLLAPSASADDAHHPAQGAAAQSQTTAPSAPAALSQSTIKALQEALGKQGIAVNADGVLSEETRAAIRKYQTEHHLPVTGEPDKATLDKLGVAPSAASTAQATPPAAQAQSGQGGMMMNCPMMQGQMHAMMQGQMHAMMQMMQGMMQMMQTMHGQMQPGQTQPGQAQPGHMGPGHMGPGHMMQPGHAQPGAK
jgi:nucleoside diphosphate kinase